MEISVAVDMLIDRRVSSRQRTTIVSSICQVPTRDVLAVVRGFPLTPRPREVPSTSATTTGIDVVARWCCTRCNAACVGVVEACRRRRWRRVCAA